MYFGTGRLQMKARMKLAMKFNVAWESWGE